MEVGFFVLNSLLSDVDEISVAKSTNRTIVAASSSGATEAMAVMVFRALLCVLHLELHATERLAQTTIPRSSMMLYSSCLGSALRGR
jgi:hypothetical protein